MKRTHDHEWHDFSQENFEASCSTIRFKGEFHDSDIDQIKSEEMTFRKDDGNDLLFQAKNTDNLMMEDDDILLGATHLNRDIPFPPDSPSSMMVEPEDPDNISVLSNEEISGTISSEEEGFPLEPTDISGIDGKRKRKRRRLFIDPVKEISGQNMHEQLTSLDDTLGSLELAPSRERLKVLKESGEASTLLSTPTQSMIHDGLKKLFSKCQPSSDFKPGTSVQKEPGREEEGTCNVVESSMMEESNAQVELSQPQTEKEVPECFAEDVNTLSPEKSNNMMNFCRDSDQKQTAAAFYSFLELKEEQEIEVNQSAPYEDIIASVEPKVYDM